MEQLRKNIDKIDNKILELLNKRAKCVIKIGKIKQKEKANVEVPQREAELLGRLISINKGPMTNKMVLHVFQEIINTLKRLQK